MIATPRRPTAAALYSFREVARSGSIPLGDRVMTFDPRADGLMII
jgi:hypothetical protein